MLEVLDQPALRDWLARFARPAPLSGGYQPEQRLVSGGVGWSGYLELDEMLGHDCPGPRLYYLDGDVEIMSTSEEHERIKKVIGLCIDDYLFETAAPHTLRGQATMRRLKEAGAEPDDSWCIGAGKQFPDLVLEVALTSGGLPKLEIYGRFAVPEVWTWRRGRLEIHGLRADGAGYERLAASRLLPGLPIAALEAAVEEREWLQARRAFRAAL